jgi:hypothetical protein
MVAQAMDTIASLWMHVPDPGFATLDPLSISMSKKYLTSVVSLKIL